MMRRETILIVDDDESFTESNKDLLEAYGYEVSVAHDGKSGVAKAREICPDLMVLDVMMATHTEGFDVAREIREIPELQNMAVLLVTGVVEAMRLPCPLESDPEWLPVDRILEKPIAPARLVGEIERALKRKKGGVPDDTQEANSVGG